MTSRLHPTDRPNPQDDFVSIAPAVAERLLGEPSSRSAREWRWGRKGSFRLKLDTGTWSDFEGGEGGGVLALVMREERLNKTGALAWLEQHGFLPSSSGRGRIGAYVQLPGKAVPAQSPYSPANQGTSTVTPEQRTKETLRWIRSQILPIADAHDHPIRAWMRRRNLWRPELPLPPSLRWIAADAPVFRRAHSGSGRDRVSACAGFGMESKLSGYSLTHRGAARLHRCGRRESRLRELPGQSRGQAEVRQCQARGMDHRGRSSRQNRGLRGSCRRPGARRERNRPGDRHPDDSTTASGLERRALGVRLRNTVAGHGRRRRAGPPPGLDASVALAQARKLAGQSIDVMGVDIGKDAADAAREAPLGSIDTEELHRFAQELESEGMVRFEALRYASTLLK